MVKKITLHYVYFTTIKKKDWKSTQQNRYWLLSGRIIKIMPSGLCDKRVILITGRRGTACI